ncbi:MAG: universal stress protein [Anaerolineales bacterium]|nr:universal stress protein [Anaerolineales bacterium]
MFKHILVPLDGSELAERVLQPAVALAVALSAKLTLLRVSPQLTLLTADPQVYTEMSRMGEDRVHAYLRDVQMDLPDDIYINLVCENGSAADVIVQYAETHAVDLIMMSSHGRSGLSRWVYGSVSEKVLHQSPCAIVIMRSKAERELFQYNQLLVPLDGSELAESALPIAVGLAQTLDAGLHLLRVTEPAHVVFETVSMHQVFNEIEAAEREEADAYLKAKLTDLSDMEVTTAVQPSKGSAANAIIDYVGTQQIDLIVMSSHGRSGLSRWVYGSIAEKVLQGSCCATMIIRN